MDNLISRQQAIDALKKDMASLDHIIKGMSDNDVRLDAYVSQRNQVNYDIYTINNLPPAQPEQLSTNLAEVGTDCISRQAAIETVMECYDNDELFEVYEDKLRELPPAFATDINVGDKDTISRKAAIDAVNCVMIMKGIRSGKSVAAEAVESAKGIIVANIRQLPSIQPKRIRGRWTRDNACSECGCQPWFSGDIHNYNFCPNCGAEMREVTT